MPINFIICWIGLFLIDCYYGHLVFLFIWLQWKCSLSSSLVVLFSDSRYVSFPSPLSSSSTSLVSVPWAVSLSVSQVENDLLRSEEIRDLLVVVLFILIYCLDHRSTPHFFSFLFFFPIILLLVTNNKWKNNNYN